MSSCDPVKVMEGSPYQLLLYARVSPALSGRLTTPRSVATVTCSVSSGSPPLTLSPVRTVLEYRCARTRLVGETLRPALACALVAAATPPTKVPTVKAAASAADVKRPRLLVTEPTIMRCPSPGCPQDVLAAVGTIDVIAEILDVQALLLPVRAIGVAAWGLAL